MWKPKNKTKEKLRLTKRPRIEGVMEHSSLVVRLDQLTVKEALLMEKIWSNSPIHSIIEYVVELPAANREEDHRFLRTSNCLMAIGKMRNDIKTFNHNELEEMLEQLDSYKIKYKKLKPMVLFWRPSEEWEMMKRVAAMAGGVEASFSLRDEALKLAIHWRRPHKEIMEMNIMDMYQAIGYMKETNTSNRPIGYVKDLSEYIRQPAN